MPGIWLKPFATSLAWYTLDNVGVIWLVNSSSVSEMTKHVDLRAHFVRDMIKDQVIKINFMKSAENVMIRDE